MTSKKKPKKTTTPRRKKTGKKRTKARAKKTVKASPPEPNAPWTAQRIAALRNKLGLTQEQFSQKLGVTYVSVNRWENGKVLPKGLSLRALEQLEAAA
jgi:DNA-binding transcriptional regulator YiaG